MQRVLVIDTSILCCWLQINGKETSGPSDDIWDYNRVDNHINERLNDGWFLVLPLASLLETGNHIANSAGLRFEQATELGNMLRKSANRDAPWAAFVDQAALFEQSKLIDIANNWPELAAGGMSIGDYLIVDVANYYARAGIEVELLTGDEGLKAYQPAVPVKAPRRDR